MNENILDINIKALELKGITNLTDEGGTEIANEQGWFGHIISYVNTSKGRFYIGGKYDPDESAKQRAKYIYNNGNKVEVFIGFADGRILREYLKIAESSEVIIVYEPCVQIFLNTISNLQVDDIILNDKVVLIFGEAENLLFSTLYQVLTIENIMNFSFFIMDNYDKIKPLAVKKAVESIHHAIDTRNCIWGTKILFQECKTINAVQNLKFLRNHYNVSDLNATIPEGVPAIIVSAGPSLDKNIDDLKEAIGKSVIISCDTALKPLIKHGIIPDAFVVVDAEKPIELFDAEEVWDIPMISNIEIPNNIMEKHRGMKFMYMNSLLANSVLSKIIGDNEYGKRCLGYVATGGSVANSAFSIAALMGAKNIILIGQDLAITGGKLHASGTFINEKDPSEEDYEVVVDAIDGGKIGTTKQFKAYKDWFERKIVELPYIRVVDATEGGALIHGSEVCSLKHAIESYCNIEIDSSSIFANVQRHLSDDEVSELIKICTNMPFDLQKIKIDLEKNKKMYSKLEKLAQKKVCSRKEIEDLLRKINNNNNKLEDNYLWETLKDANASAEYTILVSAAKERDRQGADSIVFDAKLGQDYIEGFIKTIEDIMPLAEELACSF